MAKTSHGGAFETLSDFVSTAKGIVATGQDLDEANTKAKIVTPLIRTLGWQVYDNEEVLLEYSGEKSFDKKVDYALFGTDGVHAAIEAKQIGRNITNDEAQLCEYMRLFGADWGLLTNGERYLMYESTGKSEEELAESVHINDLASSSCIQDFTRKSAYSASITSKSKQGDSLFSNEEVKKFIEFSNQNGVYEKVVSSIAPSVSGHDIKKRAFLLSLLGGVPKSLENGKAARSAIHILVVHELGTLLPDLVDSVERIAPNSVRISGNPSAESFLSGGGSPMTSSPTKITEYSIDTLVGASHAVITQFADIGDTELKYIQNAFSAEPPSNQSNSENWAIDIPALIATSNPKYGKFDQYEPFSEQFDIDPELIAQFDLIFTVTDAPERERDYEIANQVLETNYLGEVETHKRNVDTCSKSFPETPREITSGPNPQFLRKYITYARKNCYPTMTSEAQETIRSFYVEIRDAHDLEGPVPMSVRKLETIIRLAEASARLRLSDDVEQKDAERATNITRASLQDIGADPETGNFDADVVETGTTEEEKDRSEKVKDIIIDIEKEHKRGAPIDRVLERAEKEGIERSVAEHEIEKLRSQGDLYEPKEDHLRSV